MRPGFAFLRLATVSVGLACSSVAFTNAARAQESCALNYLSFNFGRLTFYYADAARDTGLGGEFGSSGAGYDLVRGVVRAGAWSGSGAASAEAGVSDDYTVSGGAPGTVFTIRARLDLTANTDGSCSPHGHCSSGNVQAILREGPSNEATYSASQPGTVAIEVTIQCIVDVPFRIFASAFASAFSGGWYGGTANLTALLDFVDLPAGFRVTSCQGYVRDGPVAVSRSTWGRLKSAYR